MHIFIGVDTMFSCDFLRDFIALFSFSEYYFSIFILGWNISDRFRLILLLFLLIMAFHY